ncbi:hypothetical protein KUTeg_022606 [Tegillarca granosa]|uniref:Uncharacterized protein n=1 Tax=Tegillarca granosa TaxID=220873 RepID=A0ABQ9E3F0_TEGGR|nr:hypothetical protein KUTeg_022606 [Tegillarca granosa]
MGCGGSSTAKEDDGANGKGNKVKPEQVVVEVASTQNGSAVNTRRIRENLREATKGIDVDELQNCINAFEKNKLEDNGDLADAKDRLEYLTRRKEIRDAILRRHAGVLEEAIKHAEASEYAGNLHHYIQQAKELLNHLRELDKYRHDILEMDQNTISEIHSYHHPPLGVHEVMTATYLILGYREEELREWADVQGLVGRIGKNSLLREVKQADTENLSDETCKKVEKLQEHFTIEQIRVVSAGVATFYEWNNNMCQKFAKDNQGGQNQQQQDQVQGQQQQQQNAKQKNQSKTNANNRKQNKG